MVDRLGAVVGQGEVGQLLPVVQEVALDQVTLVTQAENELSEPVGLVHLHDVPEHRPAADVDERLGKLVATGFSEPGTHPSAEDDDGDLGHGQLISHGKNFLGSVVDSEVRSSGQAPSARTTDIAVRSRILMSSQSDQFSM